MSNSIRLAKRLAEQVPCSRQEAEQYIAGGWVTVDGQVVEEPGFRVDESHQIALLPKANLAPLTDVTILWHKPAGIEADWLARNLTAETMAAGNRSGLRFLKRHTSGLALTNNLETSASGLVIFSQDFKIKRKLIDDASKIEQEYLAEINRENCSLNPAELLSQLNQSITLNGKLAPALKVSWQNETRLRFAGKGIQLEQINLLCQRRAGLTIVNLKRLRVGRIPLSSLPLGQWRYLLGYERF